MKKKKSQKKIDAKKRADAFAKMPRKKKCLRCGKPMIHTRLCSKCKKIKRLRRKANSRGLSKDTYLVENNTKGA